MLESFNVKNEMQYQRLSDEEKSRRGILGRLVGIIADFKNATRNGRRYTEELWDKTFNDPVVKERLDARCIFGELGHPADRQETDMDKIAICLAEMPKKGSDGKLYGVFDILDTPNGRILKTMCDYGCNIGVSSRGGGDTYEDYNGNETVDPNSYEFECFDAVLLPAVKAARPVYVTESFHKVKTLKAALLEELQRNSEEAQKIMKDTLDELNIDYSSEESTDVDESVDNTNSDSTSMAAENVGAELIEELQQALQKQQELESQVKLLQERLSVCYTKESRYSDRLGKATSKLCSMETENTKLVEQLEILTVSNNALQNEITELKASVESKDLAVQQLTESLDGYKTRFKEMKNKLNEAVSNKTSLNESLTSKTDEVNTLLEEYNNYKSSSKQLLQEAQSHAADLENKNRLLTEELAEVNKDAKIYASQSSAKLERAQQLVEKYKSVAKTAVEKYIQSQATKIGVAASDIHSRLNESYSFKDIDKVVEDLQQYKLNLNSLPFTTMATKSNKVKMQIREAKEPLLEMKDNPFNNIDDDIDEALISLSN